MLSGLDVPTVAKVTGAVVPSHVGREAIDACRILRQFGLGARRVPRRIWRGNQGAWRPETDAVYILRWPEIVQLHCYVYSRKLNSFIDPGDPHFPRFRPIYPKFTYSIIEVRKEAA